MAQFILDMFPDAIAEFGLLGCGVATLWAVSSVVAVCASIGLLIQQHRA